MIWLISPSSCPGNKANQEIYILNKGLSFALTSITRQIQTHRQLLKGFDNYAKSVRQKYVHGTYHQPSADKQALAEESTTTTTVHRRMKFLPPQVFNSLTQTYSGIGKVEHYIDATKNTLNDLLPLITALTKNKATQSEINIIKRMKQNRTVITVKPADKKLGIVLMNTDDYISHCLRLLSDTRTYRLAPEWVVIKVGTQK